MTLAAVRGRETEEEGGRRTEDRVGRQREGETQAGRAGRWRYRGEKGRNREEEQGRKDGDRKWDRLRDSGRGKEMRGEARGGERDGKEGKTDGGEITEAKKQRGMQKDRCAGGSERQGNSRHTEYAGDRKEQPWRRRTVETGAGTQERERRREGGSLN